MTTSSTNREIASKADSVMNCGRVVRTADTAYFAPHASGALPIVSYAFKHFVATVCRLSPRSKITTAVVAFIEARAFQFAEKVRVVRGVDAVAFVGDARHVLINTGGGQVFEINPGGCRKKVPNGSHGILFVDPPGFDAVTLTPDQQQFDPTGGSVLERLIIDRLPPPAGLLTKRETAALMIAAWFTGFMTDLVRGKPMVLLLGAAGVGKSVTQRLLAKAFYGASGNTTGGAGGDRALKDLFAGAAYKPVIFRDDVNRMPAAAIDSLCQIATGMTLEMAEFNKTLALSTFDVFAFLVLSAFKPTWLGRIDLMSRIIPIEFARGAPSPLTEADRTNEVLRHRSWIWAETLLALAAAQGHPKPSASPTRFDDWYAETYRIMHVYGLATEFDSALRKLAAERIRIVCDSNAEVAAIYAVANDSWWGRHEWRAAQLADKLATNTGAADHPQDSHVAPSIVRDPMRLAKLLERISIDYSGVITIVARMGHDHTNVYRMWAADQPDPLAPSTDDANDATEE